MKRLSGTYKKLKQNSVVANFLNLGSIQVSNMLLAVLAMFVVMRTVGIDAFGWITSSYRFALLAGSGINFGTGQTGVRDTALNQNDPQKLSSVFFDTLLLRLVVFIILIVGLWLLKLTGLFYSRYVLFAMPVILAEVVNPLCFFLGVEKLKVFNLCNLAANAVTLVTIVLLVHGAEEALLVNFILGMANVLTYIGLLIHFALRYRLKFTLPRTSQLIKMVKDNFYLTVNNASANLQQSIIIFALTKWSTPNILGAYSICDRFIGQVRNILNIVANSIYPKAVHLLNESLYVWVAYRRKVKRLFAVVFFAGAILTFVLADLIIFILSKQHDVTAILFLRIMAFVPVISVLNTVNVLDQLVKKHNIYIFRIATILLMISTITAVVVTNTGPIIMVGAFTLIIELCACAMYEYVINKPIQTHE